MTSYRQSQLVEIINKNPGLNFRDLMKATGMKNGVLSHHLYSLEKVGSILAVRGPRQSRFYPPSFSEDESRTVRALRRNTQRSIIRSLMLHDELEFKDIVTQTKKSTSTVSLYLSQLVCDGIVHTRMVERNKRYYLADRGLIGRLMECCRPGTLDGPVSGIEDMFNSL